MKEKHCFIPYGEFCTWHLIAFCPFMGFTFYKNFLFFITEIKRMMLFPVYTNLNSNACFQRQMFFCKIQLNCIFKITPDMCVAHRTFSLKRFIHRLFLRRTKI